MKFFTPLLALLISTHLSAQQDPILVPYKKGALWGYADTTGKILIAPEYNKVEFFSEGKAIVTKNEKLGFINTKGEVIIPVEFDHFAEPRTFKLTGGPDLTTYLCLKNHKEGFIIGDKLIIEAQQDLISCNPYGKSIYIIVKKDGKAGVYTYFSGKLSVLIPFIYTEIQDRYIYNPENLLFDCTLANSKVVVLDANGKLFKPKEPVKTKPVNTHSTQGTETIEEIYQDSKPKNGEIPTAGKVKFTKNSRPIHFYTHENSKTGLITISPLIDAQGNIVARYDTIPAIYDEIDTNLKSRDLLFVKNGLNHGMVDTKGNIVLDLVYSDLNKYALESRELTGKNYLIISKNKKRGVVELNQHIINGSVSYENKVKIPFEYDGIFTDYYHFFMLEKDRKMGAYDIEKDKLIIPIKYSYLFPENACCKSFQLFVRDVPGRTGFVGENGVEFFSE